MNYIALNPKEIIKVHKKFLSDVNKIESMQKNPNLSTFQMTENSLIKTKYSAKSLEKLQKISIENLIINKTHRGFYLKGKLFLESGKFTGITIILQDENYDLVRVSIYNFPIPNGVDYRQIFKKIE